MVLGLDFDGTCVTHEYPEVGKDIGAVPVIKKFINKGYDIVLITMRSGKELEDAVKWFNDNDIPLFGINENPKQHTWTSSPKIYANLYIDDAGFGVPLVYDGKLSNRPFVNWKKINEVIERM